MGNGYLAGCGCCTTCGRSYPQDVTRAEYKYSYVYRDDAGNLRHACTHCDICGTPYDGEPFLIWDNVCWECRNRHSKALTGSRKKVEEQLQQVRKDLWMKVPAPGKEKKVKRG